VKRWLSRIRKGEAGLALPLVLTMLAVGSLLIVPSLNYVSTNLKTGKAIEKNLEGLYAADAGVEDALWRLINDKPASFPYSYQIADINGMSVSVVIDEVTTIAGEEIGSPGGHLDWLEITKSVSYNTELGIYSYEMYLTNKCDTNIKIQKILIDFPPSLEYVNGSTGSDFTTDDPTVTGDPNTGITVIWDIPPPLPTIEPGPDPEHGQYNTETHFFELSGPPDVAGVEGHGVVEANRQDIGTVWDVDSYPYSITAQAKDAADKVVATIRAGVWEGNQLNISCWQVNP